MATPAPEPLNPEPGPLSTMVNVFVDPAAAAKGIPRNYSWAWPLLVVAVVTACVSYLNVPIALRVMQANPPGGMTPEQMQKSIGTIGLMYKAGALASPAIITAVMATLAGVLMLTCSMAGVLTNFRNLFSLLAHCSLIGMLQTVATAAVIRLKGDDIQSVEDLQPSLGLGIFFRDGVDKMLLAVLDYFSVFTLWYIAAFVIAFGALAGVSGKKAFLLSIPVWLLPLLMMVALAGLRR